MKWMAIVACIVLIGAGVFLVFESRKSYEQAQTQYDSLSAKFFDTSFKKPIVLASPSYSVVKDGYSQALSYFMLAVGLLLFVFLLPRLQNLSISPTGVNLTLKDIQQTVNTLVNQTNTIQSVSVGAGGKKATKDNMQIAEVKTTKETEHPDDPQKGKWGAKSKRNFRELSATVTESTVKGFYIVEITVESTNTNFPLKGFVNFHLHDTFSNPHPIIVVKNGKAVLKLTRVWGAFTVGAEADDGETQLELDLSKLKDAPQPFKDR